MKLFFQALILFLMGCTSVYALTFPLNQNTEVVGQVYTVTPKHLDTFSRYARIYDVGAYNIQIANPGINENYPDKQSKDIIVPAMFILPTQRTDIVINLPELRLYYFTPSQVATYPVSIGKDGWKTPIRETKVVQKEKNPSWIVPDSILAEQEAKGRPIPAVTPPGPHNPLGQYALHLGLPGYLIHGTNAPTSIGRRVSHGCIRMFPTDIEQLFNNVPVGVNVSLINEPILAGLQDNKLYLQVFPLLSEYPMSEADRQTLAKDTISAAQKGKNIQIDWNLVAKVMHQQSGIPEVVSK